ncbi:hypothetical protein ACJX0J_030296 [Zea mays]
MIFTVPHVWDPYKTHMLCLGYKILIILFCCEVIRCGSLLLFGLVPIQIDSHFLLLFPFQNYHLLFTSLVPCLLCYVSMEIRGYIPSRSTNWFMLNGPIEYPLVLLYFLYFFLLPRIF